MRLRNYFLIFFIFSFQFLFSQYNSECFTQNRERIKAEIKALPRDTVHWDTIVVERPVDITKQLNEIVGCRLPDFKFYNLSGEEFSIDKIQTDFTIIDFTFTACGDYCNQLIEQLSDLKRDLKDSLSVFTVFKEKKEKVKEFSLMFKDNIEFVADAELIYYNYSIDYDYHIIYVLDKFKNIIAIKYDTHYKYSPKELYTEYLNILRSHACKEN